MEEIPKKINFIPGTRLAVNNTQLIVSTGIPSLDDIIGGGLALGTVFLIDEDTCGFYSKIMLSYFLAEGAVNGHSLYVASQDCDPKTIVKSLPAVIKVDIPEEIPKDINDEKLTIAWRYQNMSLNQNKSLSSFGHNYDLTKVMDNSVMDKVDVMYWMSKYRYNQASFTFKNPAYHDLLQDIKNIIDKKEFSISANPEKRNVLRIALHSLGSPLWLPNGEYDDSSHKRDLDLFLYCLRALARTALVVIAVTVPGKIIDEDSISRCIYSSDLAVRLEAFGGTEFEKNESLTDYHGFFRFCKFPTINCLKNKDPGPIDFAFKMRRKKFTIEKLHLPPEIQDSLDDVIPSMGCGSANKHLLEF